jgi:glutamate racemase
MVNMEKAAAIGIFDSGIGGLTVAREIASRLPNETLIYLGDTARLPYGSKSAETVIKYAVANVTFLKQHALKAIVVACNTASAVVLPALREIVDVPVLGVIEPGARSAVEATRSGIIGIIGQPGTIRSGRYEAARLVLQEYLTPLMAREIDTLVLGCTHYPLFKSEIAALCQEEFQRPVTLVDSAVALTTELTRQLQEAGLLADSGSPRHRFFATDSAETFRSVGAAFWGGDFPPVLHVDL